MLTLFPVSASRLCKCITIKKRRPPFLLGIRYRTAQVPREEVRVHQLENIASVRRFQPRGLCSSMYVGLRTLPAVDAAAEAQVQGDPQA